MQPPAGPTTLGRTVGGFPVADNASIRYRYSNLSRADLYGGDVFGEWRLTDWMALNGSVAYVKGTNHSPQVLLRDPGDAATGRPESIVAVVDKGSAEGLPNVFPLLGVVTVRLMDPCSRDPKKQRWEFDFVSRMVKGQDYLADSLGEIRTPGYTVFDVRGWVKVNDYLRVTGGIDNIFNRTYTQHGSLVIANPNNGQIGLIPDYGINARVGLELNY